MPKLLMVTTVSSTLSAFLLPHAFFLKNQGWEVDAAAKDVISNDRCLEVFDQCFDISWGRNPFKPSNITDAIWQLKKIVGNGGYDIVHVHTPVASFITRLALRNLRFEKDFKVVYTAHGFHFFRGGHPIKNTIFKGLEKRAAKWTDHLIVINQEDYEAALTFMDGRSVSLIHGIGIDLAYYTPGAVKKEEIENFKQGLNLSKDDQLFLMVAEFNKGKRHADVIKALSICKNKDIHIAFAGKGPLLHKMKVLCEKLSVEKQTHFLGYVNDIRPCMLAASALIMPSEREGLSRSVLESLALGVPVIGSEARGVKDLLGFPGALKFPTGDVVKLANILDSFIGKDSNIRADMNQFDQRVIVKAISKIYQSLLN
jgi:glycosyltransferase involved in cell wall biosynthesis